ncbi:MarC family protein [Fervidicoccus fontis]|uniref:UPF0056 membrane protein n=1 Tax=Fervidicoccus fontis TaxID=683846 RepID=A0A843AJ88_9CREN|nr:MarC family protein [Fervidicoccus fontis]
MYMNISASEIIVLSLQLYAVMNPLVAIPKFTDLVESNQREGFFSITNKVFLTILFLSTIFVLAGGYILSFFGISYYSLKIAGGIILLTVAIDTLTTGHKPKEVETGDLIVVPIATPLIIGPGTMTSLIIFGELHGIINTLLAAYLSCFFVYLTLIVSIALLRLLGPTFINGLGKFMSLIIASFAIQMLLSGFYGYIIETYQVKS